MNIPVPSIDPPPHTIEIQARGIRAAELRAEHPGITDQSILADWANLGDNIRGWFLAEAQRRFEARLVAPGMPDDVDALVRKLTGVGADELRRQHAGPSIGVAEEPRHAAARLRTDEEQAALAPRLATGGIVSGPAAAGDDTVPAWLTGCTGGLTR